MFPTINNLTSYWILDNLTTTRTFAGILFGKNILVCNGQLIDLPGELNKSRIYDVLTNKTDVYILLTNNHLWKIGIPYYFHHSVTYNLIHKNVKNIFIYVDYVYMLCNDGKILDNKFDTIYKDISVVSNNPRCGYKCVIFIVNKDNVPCVFTGCDLVPYDPELSKNVNKIIDICVISRHVVLLYDNKTVAIYDASVLDSNANKFKNINLHNVNCISTIDSSNIEIMFDNDNAFYIDSFLNAHTCSPHKKISLTNSSYCAQFNAQTIPYYPKYFMNRFITFVMSVKYSHNIKLPKYLYFVIANHLK